MKLIICYLIIFLLYGCSGGDFKSTTKSSDNFVIENSSVAYKLATIDNNLNQKTKYSQLLEKMSEHYDKSETFIATQAGRCQKVLKENGHNFSLLKILNSLSESTNYQQKNISLEDVCKVWLATVIN